MAGSGSILGNAVLRLEDPTLLVGEGKYLDDIVETGMLLRELRPFDGGPRHHRLGRRQRGRVDARRRRGVPRRR